MGIDEQVGRISLSPQELSYLLSLGEARSTQASRDLLGLSELLSDPSAQSAGAAALLARGLAAVREDRLFLGPVAGVIGYILANGSMSAEIALMRPGFSRVVVALSDGDLTLILNGRELGVFDAIVAQSSDPVREVLTPIIVRFMDSSDNAMVAVHWSAPVGKSSVAVVRTEGARWRIATDVPRFDNLHEMAESSLGDRDRESALSELAATIPW